MKKTLIAVSFGTSVPAAQESIRAVERVLAQEAAGWQFCRAWTSPTIRHILAGRGEQVESLEETLDRLAAEGTEEILVQPTHFLYGIEYDRIRAAVEASRDRFKKITLGKPLLAGTEDLRVLADYVVKEALPADGALVLMGHGTEHFVNLVYPAFQTVLHLAGAPNAFVGTVDGWPTIENVLEQLQAGGYKKVLLAPMMLVAGDHACNDMAGDEPDSWKSILEAAGIEVHCRLRGLGDVPGVQELYRRHLKEML